MRHHILQALSISTLLLALAPAAHAQVFDVRTGPPPTAPRAYRVPPQPGPDYTWIEGYWYPTANGRYQWHNGYWSRPPYANAYWVAPYYQDGQYFTGHWEGDRGDVHHAHSWDQNRQRDYAWYGPNAYGSPGYTAVTMEQAQAIVRSAYERVLGREPDPGSSGYVDRVFRDHWSQAQIENELYNSEEYRQKHPRR